MAGEAIFEIGRRLKYVKENDLVHGEWSKWCESELGFDRQYANKFIRIYEEIDNGSTYTRLGINALYEISQIPEDSRTEKHAIPSTGESKTVDEMTVKELREVKKKLKEEEEYRKLIEEENETLQQKLKQAKSKQPKMIEKVIHIEKEVERLKMQLMILLIIQKQKLIGLIY